MGGCLGRGGQVKKQLAPPVGGCLWLGGARASYKQEAIFFRELSKFLDFGPEMSSRRVGRVFKRFLGAVGFLLPEFGPERRKFREFADFFK